MKAETTPSNSIVAEFYRQWREDGYWIGMMLSDGRSQEAGPFETQAEADRALEDLQSMSRDLGGIDVPLGPPN